MNFKDIPQESEKLINRVTETVEKTGKKVAGKVSDLTDGKAEEVTEEAIQVAVDRAIDVLQIAKQKVREKDLDGERVTLEVSVGIVNIAHLKITNDLTSKNNANENEVDVEIS